jgi:hypothetical protein
MDANLRLDMTVCSSVKATDATEISIFVDENIAELSNKKSWNT